MALSLKLDLVSDGELQNSLLESTRIVRKGIISGMTTATVTNAKMALINAVSSAPGMPLLGDAIDPTYPQYICVHRIARGIPNTGGSKAWLWLHYETPGGGGTPLERFAAEDDVSVQAEPTNVFPGTPKEILVSITAAAPEYDVSADSPEDIPVTLNWPRSMRSLVLYGLFADRPSSAVANAVNTVNSATWQGLGRGRWRCVGAKARYSSRDGMYAVTVGFLTKGAGRGDDWSTYEIPLDPTTGKRARVDTTKLATEYDKSYAYGIMSDKNAIGHWGVYQTSNFSSIFGDDFPIGD